MEIMTTWNTDFEFDLQRFANSSTTKLFLSEVKTAIDAYTGTPADADEITLDTSTGTVQREATGHSNTKLAGVNITGDLTPVATTIIADTVAGSGKITSAGATTFKSSDETSPAHSFSMATTQNLVISSYSAANGYEITDIVTATDAKVLAGKLTVALSAGNVGTPVAIKDENGATFTVSGGTAADKVTIEATKGLTAASVANTAITVVTGAALKVLTDYTVNGSTTISKTGELTVGSATNTTVVALSKSLNAVYGAGTLTINGLAVTLNNTGDGVVVTTSDNALTGISAITDLENGETVQVTNFPASATLSINGTTTIKNTATGATTLQVGAFGGEVGVVAGTIVMDADGKVYDIRTTTGTASGIGTGVKYEKGTKGDGVVVAFTDGSTPTVSDVDQLGEKVTVGGYTYTVVSAGIVKQVNDTTGASLFHTCATGSLTGTPWAASDVTASMIDVSSVTDTKYFSSLGFQVGSDDEYAVKVEGGSSPKAVTVLSKAEGDISLANTTASVTDKGTETQYTATGISSNTFTAKNGTFTSTNGVLSSVTGTLVLDQATSEIVVKGTANVDATTSTSAKAITYQAGTSVTEAKITINNATDSTLTLTETNNASGAVDTVLDKSALSLKGVDGDATITTNNVAVGTLATIETTGSGTFTLNKIAYVVADDENGVSFSVGTTAETVDGVTGIAKDATVTVSGKFTPPTTFTVNTTAFTNLSVSNGATFTATDTTGKATATLFAKGDKVTYANAAGTQTGTYEVVSMGSASDGIVIGRASTVDDYIGALNDGDKIKVTNAAGGIVNTYEVSNNILTVKEYANEAAYLAGTVTAGTTKTYTLSDGETGFSISNANNGTNWVVTGGDAGETVAAFTAGVNGSTATTTSIANGVYVNSSGEISSSETKAVGQISITDSAVTYQALTDKAQNVAVTGDSSGREDWVINTRAGKDTINYAGTSTDATISSGSGDDRVTATTTTRAQDIVIDTGEGKDTIILTNAGSATVNAGSGNDNITAIGTGEVLINADSGNNDIAHTGTNGNATIVGGSGNDTITAAGLDDVVTGGDGKDVFMITGSSVKINDYSFGNDVIQVASNTTPSVAMLTGDGKVSVAAGQVADISTGAGDYYAADIKSGTSKAVHVAWAKEGGSNIDISSYSEDVVVKGDTDGVNTLYTGAGNDTIVSLSDNDSVFGGAGKDSVTLAGGKEKRTIGISTTSGKDTVTGFKTGFSDADSIFMVDGSASDVKASFDASKSQVTFKNGSSSLQLDSISAGSSTNTVNLKVGDTKLAVLASGAKATVDSASYADVFYGDGSAIDFSAVDEALSVNLSNSLSAGGEGTKFVGVSSIVGGKGANTLMGSAKADSIVAGTGKSSLYGGAGADTLVGNSAEGDVFFFGAGTNTNIIDNFQTADKETADTVKILGDVTSAKLNSNTIELGTTDGSKAVITKLVSGSINANTMVNVDATNFTGVAKIGSSSAANSFTFDKSVGYYGGGSQTDKLTAASNFADNAEVWLDGSKGTAYGSIDAIDFSAGAGNYVLAGDSSKQTITGGRSESSLWGGVGSSADSLKGGSGTNSFFYGFGEGNDTISSSNANDSVNLYNIKLSDVKTGEITNAGVNVEFNDGSKLTVATSKDITFKLASGETYVANHSTKGWDQA